MGATDEVLAGAAARAVEFAVALPVEREWRAHIARIESPSLEGAAALLTLHDITALKRREAECLAFDSVYDALLDEYEPGMTCRELKALFANLEQELVPLARAFTHASRQPNTAFLREVHAAS